MSPNAEILQKLRAAIKHAGSQAALGERIGVSGPFISMILSGKKSMPDKVLNYLGYERVTTYRRIK